ADIWTAYRDLTQQRTATAANDLIQLPDYRMEVDLREAGHWLRINAQLTMLAQRDGLQVIPLVVNEGLDLFDDERSKKGTRVLSAALSDRTSGAVMQGRR